MPKRCWLWQWLRNHNQIHHVSSFFFFANLHEQGMVVMVQETGFFRTRCLIFYSFTLMSHRLMNRKNQINGPPFAGWFFPRGLYSVRLGSGFHLVTPVRINIDRLWVAIRVYHQDQEIFSPSRTKPGEEKVVPHSALIFLFYFILWLVCCLWKSRMRTFDYVDIKFEQGEEKNPIYQRGPGWGLRYGIEVTARRWRRLRQRGCEI